MYFSYYFNELTKYFSVEVVGVLKSKFEFLSNKTQNLSCIWSDFRHPLAIKYIAVDVINLQHFDLHLTAAENSGKIKSYFTLLVGWGFLFA